MARGLTVVAALLLVCATTHQAISSQTTTELPTSGRSTTSAATTVDDIFSTNKAGKVCKVKPRSKVRCELTKYGCCPDKMTPANDTFDSGCTKPRTCKETDFGCCPDGVSPAQGKNGEGCPVIPCEETLFGCCQSDNKTAAQRNDEEGCPPPPPACASAIYGCCADNENEAAGPNAAGCPESNICQLPMMAGPCNETEITWFYDSATDSCSLFTYGGCDGNDNRFESREACEASCMIGEVTTSRTTVTTRAPTTVRIDVGCDMMLGSNAREDKCRVCRGNGVNCHTSGGLIDSQDFIKGYNDILLIPAGATTIHIEEIAPSNNYFALRSKNGTYYLNGDYHIDFPRSLMIAGALWNYGRSQAGFEAPDILKCLGPTTEPLILSLLLRDQNVGIQYEYSVPSRLAPGTDRRYNWVHDEFTPCSAECGGGTQTRNVTCRSSEELDVVDDGLCDEGLKPPTNQSCNNSECPPEWVTGNWSECSKRCGNDGIRERTVTCQMIIANGYPTIIADTECMNIHGVKPAVFEECNRNTVCPQWFVGRWQACDKLCDEGTQKRQVVCYQKINGRIEVLDDEECDEEKPIDNQPCMLSVCEGTDWIATEWTGCDDCLSTVETRRIVCASLSHQVYNDSFCAYHNRPITERPCLKSKLPECEGQWYATQWSKCSVDCGDGIQTRRVFCGLYSDGSVTKVNDTLCADKHKYNDTKPCSVPIEECPYQWYVGEWEKCNAVCDGGEQLRRVMCIIGNKPSDACPVTQAPETSRSCNLHPCNADLITVSTTTVTDDDDLPFCDDEAES